MKPKMNLTMRISVNECHKQRFTEEDIKQEFAKDNVKIERTLVVRKSDGAVMGQILIDEINVLERKYERELCNSWDDDIYTVNEWEEAVLDGEFNSDDGSGYWVKDGLRSDDEVFSTPKLDATHVVWYNK